VDNVHARLTRMFIYSSLIQWPILHFYNGENKHKEIKVCISSRNAPKIGRRTKARRQNRLSIQMYPKPQCEWPKSYHFSIKVQTNIETNIPSIQINSADEEKEGNTDV